MIPFPRGKAAVALLSAAGAVLLAVTLTYLAAPADAVQSPGINGAAGLNDASVFGAKARPIELVPADDPARGLIYGGLRAARTGPCVGGYEVIGVQPVMCTHGPDATPVGLDARRSVAPLAPAAPGIAPAALAVCEGD